MANAFEDYGLYGTGNLKTKELDWLVHKLFHTIINLHLVRRERKLLGLVRPQLRNAHS